MQKNTQKISNKEQKEMIECMALKSYTQWTLKSSTDSLVGHEVEILY